MMINTPEDKGHIGRKKGFLIFLTTVHLVKRSEKYLGL